MANNILSGDIASLRRLIRQSSQQEISRHNDVRQSESVQAEDMSPGAEVQRFVQSTDEMSAAMAQFRHRRDYDKKSDSFANSFERVLDDDVLPKAKQILQMLRTQNISIEKLLYYIRNAFPDDSDLVLVLRELLRRHKSDEIVQKKIHVLLQNVEEQTDSRLLNAGVNCALKAKLYGKKLALRPGLLRTTYRHFIQSNDPESEIYADWVSSYGYQCRFLVLNYIEESLLTDINSLDASCSGVEFGDLLGRLSQIKLLRSADLLFINTLITRLPIDYFTHDESLWLLFMLAIVQQPKTVDSLLPEIVGSELILLGYKERSFFLQILYLACKSLPVSLFTEDAHAELLEKLKEMMGTAYQHEMIGQNSVDPDQD
ncbi:type III secretion system gatekeeper subunit SctW [Citrobacter portucalensis]|uniref:type III secretion system gatekeeper subunit SctW n=1 Tax=Citrobacter portucalensis TaxID=1639133 RepID=UPI001EB9DF44|nr:type III secretion system gatekeeper subunit SctW [Citrobacter portucalensis]EDS3841753.1 YopN family type III secretion system gatekeeper subunit [Salmonella enterica]WNI88027.1 type III secretion system gatekeeper subunit SctW [Citrobacter portucalensis]